VSDQEGSTDPAPGSVGRPPGIIRAACIVLLIAGFGSVMLTAPGIMDPAGARCTLAKRWLDDANTDKKAWNNVDLGGRKTKDLTCAEAIGLTGQIRLHEKGTGTAKIPGDGAVRLQATLTVIVGLGQALSGSFVLRRLSRKARTAAIAFCVPGIVLGPLGPVSLGVFVFVAYAFAVTPASKELWPRAPRAPR
jgi:hypothetical protein